MTGEVAIVVVTDDVEVGGQLRRDLDHLLRDAEVDVVALPGAEGVEGAARLVADGVRVPVAFLGSTASGGTGADTAMAMQRDESLQPTRRVVVTTDPALRGVGAALDRGAIDGMVTVPWSRSGLEAQLRSNLATHHLEHDPAGLDRYGSLIGPEARRQATQRIAERRGAHRGEHGTHPLFDIGLDDDEAERRVVAAIDRFLGHPPRLRVAAGTVLLQQGSDVGGIYLVLDGEVALRRHAGGVEDTQESAGPIVGLLSLATRRRASFEVVAVTEVRAVPLTLSQLEAVFTAEPEVASLLTRTLLAVLGDRLRGAHELRAQLVDAQDALVSQARLATLGELAAGLAHELSNPAAALERAVDHLGDDLAVLLADEPDVVAALAAARAAPPVPASTQRAVRRALAEATGDRARAEVVAEAAGWDPERAESLLDLPAAEVARLAAVHRLGVNLRNANVSAERVAALVSSLRAYLRGGSEGPMSAAVAVGGTLDDALRILGHRLEDLTVQRRDEPVPTVVAQPGQLQQVWTNLLANAVDAAGPGGRIEIVLDAPDPAHVRVRVTDDGPGIAPTDRDRVFAPRFTTKGGRVAYGLGLGLSVVERVVAAHGGTVAVTGAPGRTTFAVVLPVVPPDADPEER